MSAPSAGFVFLALLMAALVAVHVPLGDYMYRVYSSKRDWRVERVIYRIVGADPKAQQKWDAYAFSILAFSAVGIVFLFFLQLLQGKLPLHLHDPPQKASSSASGSQTRRSSPKQARLLPAVPSTPCTTPTRAWAA